MHLSSVSKIRASLLIIVVVAMGLPTYGLQNCPQEVTGVSSSGCTRITCYLDYEIDELRTHRSTCYYGNCNVITISPCL
jgi:hypothetical protein